MRGLLALLIPALLLTGCTEPTGRTSTEDGDLPQLRIEPEATAWPHGQWRNLTVVFQNDSDRWFNYTAPNGCSHLGLYVTLGGRRIDLPGPWAPGNEPDCVATPTPVSIAPGQRVERRAGWNGTYFDPDSSNKVAPPGTYELVADAPAPGPWDVRSAPLTVTLRAPGEGL